MLEKEKINKNFKKWVSTIEKNGVDSEKILGLIGKDLVIAESELYPYEGGLIHEALTLTKYAVALNGFLPEDKRVDLKSLVKISLIYNIGEYNKFEDHDNTLNDTETVLAYLINCGVKLSFDEYFGLINHKSKIGSIIDNAYNMIKIEKMK